MNSRAAELAVEEAESKTDAGWGGLEIGTKAGHHGWGEIAPNCHRDVD